METEEEVEELRRQLNNIKDEPIVNPWVQAWRRLFNRDSQRH